MRYLIEIPETSEEQFLKVMKELFPKFSLKVYDREGNKAQVVNEDILAFTQALNEEKELNFKKGRTVEEVMNDLVN